MKGRAIDQLVFETMFPCPKPGDPTNFHQFLQKHLVNEVRAETTHFYGDLKTREAQYPGLDYSYTPHRVRLGRYPWHDILFQTFDRLGLTRYEIKELTKWEGTLWAKERYEKEHNIIIRDTTGDSIGEWVPHQSRILPSFEIKPPVHPDFVVGDAATGAGSETSNDIDDEEDDSDTEIDSVGVDLNRRLLADSNRVAGGNELIDEEFEEWLKAAVESGRAGRGPIGGNPSNRTSPPLPPRYIHAARLGQLPEEVRDLLRAEWTANTEYMLNSLSRTVHNRSYSPSGQRRLRQTMRNELQAPSMQSRYAAQDLAARSDIDHSRLTPSRREHHTRRGP